MFRSTYVQGVPAQMTPFAQPMQYPPAAQRAPAAQAAQPMVQPVLGKAVLDSENKIFIAKCDELTKSNQLQAQIQWLNRASAKEHPAFIAVEKHPLMNMWPSGEIENANFNLPHLIKLGLDIDRPMDASKPGSPILFKVLLGWKNCGPLLADAILRKKKSAPEYLTLLSDAYRNLEKDLASPLVKDLNNQHRITLFSMAVKNKNMELAALTLEHMTSLTEAEKVAMTEAMKKLLPAPLAVKEIIRSSIWEILELGDDKFHPVLSAVFSQMKRDDKLALCIKAIDDYPHLSNAILLQLNPLTASESKTLSDAFSKAIPQEINATNIFQIPLWKIPALFAGDFKYLLPNFVTTEMVQWYVMAMKASPKAWDENQVKLFVQNEMISAEFLNALNMPIFKVIGTGEIGPFSEEIMSTLGVLIVGSKTEQLLPFIYYALTHAGKVQKVLGDLKLEYLSIADFGESRDQWTDLLQQGITHGLSKRFVPQFDANRQPPMPLKNIGPIDLDAHIKNNKLKFIQLLGRTIIFGNENKWVAIKIQKVRKKETLAELEKEQMMQAWLTKNKHVLRLESEYPTPVSCGQVLNLEKILDENISKAYKDWLCDNFIGDDLGGVNALVYEASPSYFSYLHEVDSTENLRQSSLKSVNDLIILLKNGYYFDTLADMFHNKEDGSEVRDDSGRYLVLNHLLRPVRTATGLGRLNGWLSAIEYVNLRESGLADLGDVKVLDKDLFNKDSVFVKTFLSELYNTYGEDNPEMRIYLNCIAEYLYVFMLVVGRHGRLHTMGQSQEVSFDAWKAHAEILLSLCARALEVYSGKDFETAHVYLSSSINLDRLARQLQFWMTKENISYVKQMKLPSDVYASDSKVIFRSIREGTFNDKYGCCINPENGPDLGAVNGQEPIKEMNKLIQMTCLSILSSMEHDATNKQVKKHRNFV